MGEVISVEFLNFGDGDGDEKRLVGLRQASGRRQKLLDITNKTRLSLCLTPAI